MSDTNDIYSCWDFPSILRWDHDLLKPKFFCLSKAPLEHENILDYPRERDLSEPDRLSESGITPRAHDRGDACEIDTRLADLYSSSDIHVNIVVIELHIGELRDNSDEKIEFPSRDSSGRSLRIAELRIGGKRFDLDQNRTISFDGKRKCRPRELTIFGIDKFESWIRKIDQSFFCHAEKSDCISRSETVLK